MASIIQQLPDGLINQIAAGEVIENPSSVVKELVENAIDAKATLIEIEIKGGGLQQIVIHDNGYGMSPKDLLLSVERHATSKIRHFTDLSSLLTMGFRGEAMASIASISKMKIESAQEGKKAHVLEIEGGKILQERLGAREKGTTIEVNSLFYNVPARKKFQKSMNANVSMIKRTVDLLALANPQVGFTLSVQDSTILSAYPHDEEGWQEKMKARVGEVLGANYFSSLLELSFSEGPFHFRGFVGLPSYAKRTRGGQYLFINQRAVFSPIVSNAIREGYGTAISDGYHPIFVIDLQMPPDFVDVNVHPQKREVRLRDEFFLKEKIKEATSLALQGNFYSDSAEEQEGVVSDFSFTPMPNFFQKSENNFSTDPIIAPMQMPIQEDLFSLEKISPSYVFHELGLMGHYLLVEMKNFSDILSRFSKEADEEKECLLIVDLQATSARILYDAISSQGASDPLLSQQLLFPITLDMSTDEVIHINDHVDELALVGVDARVIGDKTVAIDALPFFIKEEECETFLASVVEELSLFGKIDKAQDSYKKRIARRITSFAKAQKKNFEMDEARTLFEKLLRSKERYNDPLGHPTIMRLTKNQIEKMFSSLKN